MLRDCYMAGWEKYAESVMEKTAGGQAAGLVSSVLWPFGGLVADKGKGWDTASGSALGSILGWAADVAILNQIPGYKRLRLTRSPIAGMILNDSPAKMLGSYLGARAGHGDYAKLESGNPLQLFANNPG